MLFSQHPSLHSERKWGIQIEKYGLCGMPQLTASPATLGVPKVHQTLPSLFSWHTASIFQFDRNHQAAALEGGDGGVITALVIRICVVYSVNTVTAPVGFLPAQLSSFLEKSLKRDRWKCDQIWNWTLVQYSTCTRLKAHTKIKITLTVCLIALRPVIARTFPVPVLLETIQAPLISMEANLCAH